MTALDFSGPGLSEEQWRQVKTLATSLGSEQAVWLSGYFAGFAEGGRGIAVEALRGSVPLGPVVAAPTTPSVRTLTILYGSETGNSAALAKALAEAARAKGVEPIVADMADYKPRRLKDEQDLLIITSTHGEGEPPLSAAGFFEFVEGRKAPRLEGVRYSILALGDSTYEFFCGAGKRLDDRLAELGATRIRDRVDCDIDYEDPSTDWISSVVEKLGPAAATPSLASSIVVGYPAAPVAAAFDKRNPFLAPVIDNLVLTGRGSSKETRHVELSLEGSGLSFEPGDALGLTPRNDPVLVETLLQALNLGPDANVSVKDRTLPFGDALAEAFEITAATPRFLDHWAELTKSNELESLRGEDAREARVAFLGANHVIDIVRRFPVAGIDAQTFLAGLRPLQPRLYSIASSAAAAPDEVHLTVSTVRYDLNGEPRSGVASGHLAARAEPDSTLPVYVQANPHFRLPDDDKPIIMIGAGTGVAPYRAFLQEREMRGAGGKAWLFFGERNFDSDFLYQTEWQDFLKEDVLSRMNVAFSRDRAEKVYVQHRLLEEARDVYAWLEDGAHVYVCGDGAKLAPDVHAALATVVREQGRLGEDGAGEYLSAMQADHRYQIDVY
jgi:sulfite reductase (NADPH) flavoprotein alpha-component